MSQVCDFGMSRLQHHTFLSSKSAAGTVMPLKPAINHLIEKLLNFVYFSSAEKIWVDIEYFFVVYRVCRQNGWPPRFWEMNHPMRSELNSLPLTLCNSYFAYVFNLTNKINFFEFADLMYIVSESYYGSLQLCACHGRRWTQCRWLEPLDFRVGTSKSHPRFIPW